jgi:hypothetical protein
MPGSRRGGPSLTRIGLGLAAAGALLATSAAA